MTLGLSTNLGMSGAQRDPERKACSEPFMKLVVNFNGQVSVCCVDWAHETVIGDVRSETLYGIWNGDRLRRFRLKHLAGERNSLTACASCDYVLGLPSHTNFDDKVGQLLPLYSQPKDCPSH